MGNTSSQIVGPEQSQPQSSSAEVPTAPQALEIPAERLDKSARVEMTTFTPPPTGVLKETDSDSGQSHPSVDRDEAELGEIEDPGSDEAVEQSTLHGAGSPELGDFSFVTIHHHLVVDSREIPQFNGTMDSPPSVMANGATMPGESLGDVQFSPAEEARRAKAERKRVRAEKRARKISRQLQRAMGSTPQAHPTIETGLGAPFVEDETLVPETQPDAITRHPGSLPADVQEAHAEVRHEETTPRAAELKNEAALSAQDVDMSYDFDDPGTQLRMEAERAQRARTSTTQELSSPLKRKEQEPKPQKHNSKKRKAASVEFEEEAANSPSQQRLSKKQAIASKAAGSSERTNVQQAKNTPAKSTSKKAKRQTTQPAEVQKTQPGEDDMAVDVARSPESSPSQVPASSKPILTLSTDPPHGAKGSTKPQKRRVRKSDAQKIRNESDATPNKATMSGPFKKEEINKVQIAIGQYCEQNNLSENAFKEMLQPKNSSKTLVTDAVNWVQDALPDRSRKSIRQFVQRRYSAAHRGPWTPDEDKDLKEAYEEKPGNWVYIAALLGRLAEDCRDRWRDYVGNPDKQEGVWTDHEEAELEKAVAECISRMRKERLDQKLDDLDDAVHEANVNWSVVSGMLGKTRSRLQCRYKWAKLHDRKFRIAETGTPHPRRRKSGGLTSTPGNTNATPAMGSKSKSSKSSAAKKPKATKEAGDKSIQPSSSAKSKKARRASAPHSSKKYLSAAKVTSEDDEIEDSTQPQYSQRNDDMEVSKVSS
ncbi:hypothetical protein BDZ85DRAFT_6316 [Elsinoe ampelina]|uniref:Myb-like DNA-binding domain-containing protein n=1 Tax=Elsinoe ampelina TaxID=302913 RepID=A0A6A6GPZ6_9PEZI|nr:hypothetical protein BDZ85DRAFT_6316 [Elsinoe ampelina]